MMGTVLFPYVQARLQTRHGQRPDEFEWRRLHASGDLAHFLQAARTTTLRPWIMELPTRPSSDVIERSLRRQFRQYVVNVATWPPRAWRPAIIWTALLVDLPCLTRQPQDESVPPWMKEDPALHPFVPSSRRERIEAMGASDWSPLVEAWESRSSPLEAWVSHWRRLWPLAPDAFLRPLEALLRLMLDHRQRMILDGAEADGWRTRAELTGQLEFMFRRYAQQPAAVFSHLALVALDLERLRGALVRRTLFPNVRGRVTWV